jgi:hypothetical protein
VIVIKTAVSPLWHCKDRLKALKNQTWNWAQGIINTSLHISILTPWLYKSLVSMILIFDYRLWIIIYD